MARPGIPAPITAIRDGRETESIIRTRPRNSAFSYLLSSHFGKALFIYSSTACARRTRVSGGHYTEKLTRSRPKHRRPALTITVSWVKF